MRKNKNNKKVNLKINKIFIYRKSENNYYTNY